MNDKENQELNTISLGNVENIDPVNVPVNDKSTTPKGIFNKLFRKLIFHLIIFLSVLYFSFFYYTCLRKTFML